MPGGPDAAGPLSGSRGVSALRGRIVDPAHEQDGARGLLADEVEERLVHVELHVRRRGHRVG